VRGAGGADRCRRASLRRRLRGRRLGADDQAVRTRRGSMPEAAVVREAVEFMLGSYREARRPEAAEHPLEVAALLVEAGAPADLIAAALLHDVVEDTGTSLSQVRARFGPRIAGIVAALTENAEIGDLAERKRALRDAVAADSPAAREVFAADKVARLRAAEREG